MTTPPPYELSQDFGHTFVPVPQSLWKYFSTSVQAQEMLAKAAPLLLPNVELQDWTQYFGQPMIVTGSNPDKVAIWVIVGTGMPGVVDVQEFAGDLFDRQTKPNPFIDANGSGPAGGPNLALEILSGVGQLHWTK